MRSVAGSGLDVEHQRVRSTKFHADRSIVATIVDGLSKRSALIASLLLGILAFTVVAVLQGQGDYLIGALVTVGFWSLLGLIMMMRWTISMQFWAGIGSWFRSRRR